MSEDIKKLMQQVTRQVTLELERELSKIADIDMSSVPTALSDLKNNTFGELISDILTVNVNGLSSFIQKQHIPLSKIYLQKRSKYMIRQVYGIDSEYSIIISGSDDDMTKQLRTYFYGGEIKDDNGELLVISPNLGISSEPSQRFYEMSTDLNKHLIKKINEKKKLIQEMSIKQENK